MIIKFFRKSKTLTKALVLYYFIIDCIQHIQNGEQAHMATQKKTRTSQHWSEKSFCVCLCVSFYFTQHIHNEKKTYKYRNKKFTFFAQPTHQHQNSFSWKQKMWKNTIWKYSSSTLCLENKENLLLSTIDENLDTISFHKFSLTQTNKNILTQFAKQKKYKILTKASSTISSKNHIFLKITECRNIFVKKGFLGIHTRQYLCL